jgi:hypothetical protein
MLCGRPVRAFTVLILAVLGVTAGCGGDEATSPPTTSSVSTTTVDPEAESRAWLGHYAVWVTDLRIALERENRAALESCGETLRAKLGDTPEEFAETASALARACELLSADVSKKRRFRVWATASRLIRSANDRLPTPQPMERLPLPIGSGLLTDSRVEPLFTKVANRIAASVGQVRCWSKKDWRRLVKETFGRKQTIAGFASMASKRANLASDICADLATLAYTQERPRTAEQGDIAFAVATLMHEAGHLNESGDFYGAGSNEPLAECWGMQHIRQAARALGAGKAYADELAEGYWRYIYPSRSGPYRTPKCRNGGAYDVRPGTDRWP